MKDMIKEIDNLILEKKESINFEEFVDLYGIDESLEPTSKEEIKKYLIVLLMIQIQMLLLLIL